MMGEVDMQIFYFAVILLGAIVVAIGGFGSSIEQKKAGDRDQAVLQTRFNAIQAELNKFEAQLDKKHTDCARSCQRKAR